MSTPPLDWPPGSLGGMRPSKFELSVVYVPGKDNAIADVLGRRVYPAGRTLEEVSVHGDATETK